MEDIKAKEAISCITFIPLFPLSTYLCYAIYPVGAKGNARVECIK